MEHEHVDLPVPSNDSSKRAAPVSLEFNGKAIIRVRKKSPHYFVGALNKQSEEVAQAIQEAIVRQIPTASNTKVLIRFYEGSIAWTGVVTIAERLGNVVDVVAFTQLAAKAVRVAINHVIGQRLSEQCVVEQLDTKVTRTMCDQFHPLLRFAWWCAGSVAPILVESKTEHTKHAGIGVAVFSTGLLASLTGGHALFTMFAGSEYRHAIAAIAALLWGAIIFNTDRLMVASMRKSEHRSAASVLQVEAVPALLRACFAFLIAFTIAVPLEMRLFEPEIAAQIRVDVDRAVTQRDTGLRAASVRDTQAIDAELKKLQLHLDEAAQRARSLERSFLQETDGTGGTRERGYAVVARIKEKQYIEAKKAFELERDKAEQRTSALQTRLAQIDEDRRRALTLYRSALGSGFLANHNALSSLTQESSGVAAVRWAIFLLVLAVELLPIGLKLSCPYGPYDACLNLREKTAVNEAEAHHFHEIAVTNNHYNLATESDKAVDAFSFERSTAIRKSQVQEAWEQFARAFTLRPQHSVSDLVRYLRQILASYPRG